MEYERLADDELEILYGMLRMGEKVRWEKVVDAVEELRELRALVRQAYARLDNADMEADDCCWLIGQVVDMLRPVVKASEDDDDAYFRMRNEDEEADN